MLREKAHVFTANHRRSCVCWFGKPVLCSAVSSAFHREVIGNVGVEWGKCGEQCTKQSRQPSNSSGSINRSGITQTKCKCLQVSVDFCSVHAYVWCGVGRIHSVCIWHWCNFMLNWIGQKIDVHLSELWPINSEAAAASHKAVCTPTLSYHSDRRKALLLLTESFFFEQIWIPGSVLVFSFFIFLLLCQRCKRNRFPTIQFVVLTTLD